MSHEQEIARRNAALNTTETWQQRWQIEREANERLTAQAERVRTGVHVLRARAVERFGHNQQYATEARSAGDQRRQEVYERMCTVQSGMVRALDDVLELLDSVSKQP